MKPKLTYKVFNGDTKNVQMLYTCSVWISEFKFIKTEINFLKLLINSYPFKTMIPNLFEKLQLFILELERFEIDKNSIVNEINLVVIQFNIALKKDKKEAEILKETNFNETSNNVYDYLERYRILKSKIYEFISDLIV